jgi:N-acetylglucosamine malate deacetylase 1
MNKNKLDILAFGAHPDDVDACAGGMISKCVQQGMKVGIVDLTAGDNSETADGATRIIESQRSAKILGVTFRKNLKWADRSIKISDKNEEEIAKVIRICQPRIVLLPYWEDRHKGHRDTSLLVERAVQTAKYSKILPNINAHKVQIVIYYMIHYEFEPNFIFDISESFTTKMKALNCHKSQLFTKDKFGRYTKEYADKNFMEAWEARSRWYGYISGVKYGEAYAMRRPIGINNLNSLTNLYR